MAFLFISPLYPSGSVALCRQFRLCGLKVYGLVDSWPPTGYEDVCDHLEYVDLKNEGDVFRTVDRLRLQHNVTFSFVEAFSDYWLELESRLRVHLGLTYTNSGPEFERQLTKSGMKSYYEQAAVPTADYIVTQDSAELRRFVAKVGLPVIAKPDRGSGALGTVKLDDEAELGQFIASRQLEQTPFIVEEFIDGDLVSFDGLCDLDGTLVFSSVGHFRVACLDLCTSQADCSAEVGHKPDPAVEKAGRACCKSFGIRGRWFHMEFFVRRSDKLVMGLEVNMRAQPLFFPIWDVVFSVDPVVLYVDVLHRRPVALPASPALPHNAMFFSRRSRNRYVHSHDEIFADRRVFSYTKANESQLLGDHLYYASHPTWQGIWDLRDFAFRLAGATEK